jgi:hypothetical protein
MPAYKIQYNRADMPNRCTAMKFAHTEKEALEHLCVGSEKKGTLRLARSGVPIKNINIKEIK